MKAKKSKTALRLLAFLLAFAMAFTAMPVMALDAELPYDSEVSVSEVPEYEAYDYDAYDYDEYDYDEYDYNEYEVSDEDYGYYGYVTEDEPVHGYVGIMPLSDVTVTFAGNGGTWATAPAGWVGVGTAPFTSIRRAQAPGSAMTLPLVFPARAGYRIHSSMWNPVTPATWPATAQTFNAVWTEGTTTQVTFDGNGGTWATAPDGWSGVGTAPYSSITRRQTLGTAMAVPSVFPTRAGYRAHSSLWNSSLWGSVMPTIWPQVPHTFNAVWTAAPTTLTFSGNGGTWETAPVGWSGVGTAPYSSITRTQAAGTAMVLPSVFPTRAGYRIHSSLWSPATPAIWPSLTQTFNAVWTAGGVMVTLDGNGGTWETAPAGWVGVGTAPFTSIRRAQEPGSDMVLPSVFPTREGHRVHSSMWSPAPSLYWPQVSQTFNVVWTAFTGVSVTFNGNGGTWATAPVGWVGVGTAPFTSIRRAQEPGTAMTLPPVFPTRAGYRAHSSLWTETPTTWPQVAQTVNAVWTAGPTTITLSGNGGTWATAPEGWVGIGTAPFATITRSQAAGTPMVLPSVPPTRAGHRIHSSLWSPVTPAIWPSLTQTFNAVWTRDWFMITLNGGGGTWATAPEGWTGVGTAPFTSITSRQRFGEPAVWPAVDPIRPGHTPNAAWNPARPTTWPAADTTYTAQWTATGTPPTGWGRVSSLDGARPTMADVNMLLNFVISGHTLVMPNPNDALWRGQNLDQVTLDDVNTLRMFVAYSLDPVFLP